MINVVIIGAGYPDLFDVIEDINAIKKKINVLYIVDEKRYKKKKIYGHLIRKNFHKSKNKKKDFFLVNNVASTIENREKIFKKFNRKFKFTNIIHPDSKIGNLKIGKGNIICKNVYIGKNLNIKNNNLFSPNVYLGHDTKINSNCFFGPNSTVLGNVKIKNNNFIGSSSTIIQSCIINENCTISMASVVFSDLKKFSKVIGNPAR